jgi:uncharacterized flavoprotein (TIGR03862 family)
MAAEVLLQAGSQVHLFEAMPSVGRKFLVAGKGGLNLTHSEAREQFLGRYGARRARLEPFLAQFGPDQLRQWAAGLGIETFVGTSGRVFPIDMKAAPLLYAWRQRLTASRLVFHMRHAWLGWGQDGSLRFSTPGGEINILASPVILALGGASWPQLGSTGAWTGFLSARGVSLAPFKPSNCGFDVKWSEHFQEKYDGQPLKSVSVSFTNAEKTRFQRQGEFIVTRSGIEGSLIYALSAPLRDEIETSGSAILHIDLAPAWSPERLADRLSLPRGSRSVSSHLEKAVGIRGVKAGLLWEFIPRHHFDDPARLATAIKALRVTLIAPRPLDEAISSAGGVTFESLDEHLMLRAIPGVFCAGEMLDWEAPTGGYLISACFATGYAAGQGAVAWARDRQYS